MQPINNTYLQNVKINSIQADDNDRPIDEPHVAELMESITGGSLESPVRLSKDLVLISGFHRLEACKRLGWSEIPALISDKNMIGNENKDELLKMRKARHDENMVRLDYNEVQKCKAVLELRQIYEHFHPETKKSAIIKKNRQGISTDGIVPFSKDCENRKIMSQKKAQEYTSMATKIVILDEIQDTILATQYDTMLALKKMQPEHQRQFLKEFNDGLVKKPIETLDAIKKDLIDTSPAPTERVEGVDFQQNARMFCSDYLDVIGTLKDGRVNLVLTDAPFNRKVNNEEWDRDFDPIKLMNHCDRILAEDGSALIFCDSVLLNDYLTHALAVDKDGNKICGLNFKQIIHYNKSNRQQSVQSGGSQIKMYNDSVEYILWFTKSDKYTFNSDKIDNSIHVGEKTTLIETPQTAGGERFSGDPGQKGRKSLHACQKRYDIIASLLETHSNRGDLVVDPFLGTGTTAYACAKHGRSVWGTEINPKWFNLAAKRYARQMKTFNPDTAEEVEAYAAAPQIWWSEIEEAEYEEIMQLVIAEELLQEELQESMLDC